MLYRFQIELSDIDRGVYESLDFRVALHPSETAPYLISRALAYCMSYRPDLEFSAKGLADPDSPALLVNGQAGAIDVWIEIGNPAARKLHKASKAAREVIVFTYKNPQLLKAEIASGDVHRADKIRIYAFGAKPIDRLEKALEKNNKWTVLIQDGRVNVEGAGFSAEFETTSA